MPLEDSKPSYAKYGNVTTVSQKGVLVFDPLVIKALYANTKGDEADKRYAVRRYMIKTINEFTQEKKSVYVDCDFSPITGTTVVYLTE